MANPKYRNRTEPTYCAKCGAYNPWLAEVVDDEVRRFCRCCGRAIEATYAENDAYYARQCAAQDHAAS